VRFCDLAAIELSWNWIQAIANVGNVEFAVDFRCVHGGAAFEQHVRLFGRAFEQDVEFFSSERLFLAAAECVLILDQLRWRAGDFGLLEVFI